MQQLTTAADLFADGLPLPMSVLADLANEINEWCEFRPPARTPMEDMNARGAVYLRPVDSADDSEIVLVKPSQFTRARIERAMRTMAKTMCHHPEIQFESVFGRLECELAACKEKRHINTRVRDLLESRAARSGGS